MCFFPPDKDVASNGWSKNLASAPNFLPPSSCWLTSKSLSTDQHKTNGLLIYHGCLMDSPGWLFFGWEFQFTSRTEQERGWIKGSGCVSIDYHLGRASGRCQELAGIGVQSGSH